MARGSRDNTVVVMRSESYDRARIEEIVSEGMRRLGYRPRGRVFVKPNVVFAYDSKRFGDMAWTPPAFVGASLLALTVGGANDTVQLAGAPAAASVTGPLKALACTVTT